MAASVTHDSDTQSTAIHDHSYASSSRPIINNDNNTITTMSDINGKAPINGDNTLLPGEPAIKVQPPRREDLQPSYARVIKPDDADSEGHGWYGAMVCWFAP